LAELAEVYVNDAFGSSHRAHASVVGMVSHFRTKGIGFLMHKEIAALSRLRETPAKPFVVILGGAKVSDKLGLIRGLLSRKRDIESGGIMKTRIIAIVIVALETFGACSAEGQALRDVFKRVMPRWSSSGPYKGKLSRGLKANRSWLLVWVREV
jgi:3-phosphoglycerate kinase